MELAYPPPVRRVDGENGQADRCGAFAIPVGDDDVAEGREAEGVWALMEGNDLAPLPAQRRRLRRDGSQVPAQRVRVAPVARRSDQDGRMIEQGNQRVDVAGIDRRLKCAENRVCVG